MPIPNQYFISLLQLSNIGTSTANKIANHCDSQRIEITSAIDLNDLIKVCIDNIHISNKLQFSDSDINEAINKANIIIEKSHVEGIHIISKYDSNYPKNLTLGSLNNNINTNPPILYCKGNTTLLNHENLAIIGTRNPTKEGEIASEFIGSYFAKNGYNIISGLALGCDSVAHKSALKVESFTTVVLASGLDSVNPMENNFLAQEILNKSGLLISEYPVGTTVTKYNLVQRDRIVAGMCDKGIVIQSTVDGGTVITAKEILKQKKSLYMVKYKSSDIMNSDVGKGNTFLKSLGGEFVGTGDLDGITMKN